MGQGFEGMDALIRDLEELRGRALPEAGRPAVELAGRAAVAIAKGTAPRRTGKFARSIHVGGAGEQGGDFNPGADRNWYEDMGKEEGSATSVAVSVGTTLWYAPWVEYGGPKNPASYCIGNAVDAVGPVLRDALEMFMDDLARKVGF